MKILNIRRCSILTQFAELEQKAIRLELETVFPVPGISWNLLDPGITKHTPGPEMFPVQPIILNSRVLDQDHKNL